MNNEELKKKIAIAVAHSYDDWVEEDYARRIQKIDFDKLADALILAGIGDVKEAKFESDHYWRMWQGALVELERAIHRAEVAEKALKNLAQLCAKGARYYLQSDKAVKERERELYDEWIKQAEKELAEERKE